MIGVACNHYSLISRLSREAEVLVLSSVLSDFLVYFAGNAFYSDGSFIRMTEKIMFFQFEENSK